MHDWAIKSTDQGGWYAEWDTVMNWTPVIKCRGASALSAPV